MNDLSDGSSGAAQSARPKPKQVVSMAKPVVQSEVAVIAPPEIEPPIAPSVAPPVAAPVAPKRTGFVSRLFQALSPPEKQQPLALPAPSGPTPGILNLRRMRVEDVMLPKADILSVPITINKTDLVKVFRDSGLTRIPVFDGTLDTPLGFVHLKDLALRHGFNGTGGERFDLKNMLRPLLYVPHSMTIGVLLSKMQAVRTHMALVIDEYGGTDGLVTIEDLIEQVIGEIEDEHDIAEDELWTHEKPGIYLALAKTPLEEFQAEIGVDLTAHEDIDEEEIETLGGLVFMLAGKVPARGEVVPHPQGAEFEVVDADPRRIKRLRVRLPDSVGYEAMPSEPAQVAE